MKKIKQLGFLMLSTITILHSGSTYAQKVVVENGRTIVDASSVAHTTTPKPLGLDQYAGFWSDRELSLPVNDARVFKKFEVAKTDLPDTYYIHQSWTPEEGTQEKSYLQVKRPLYAHQECTELPDDGKGKWRLPTRRELVLMWILKVPLEKTPNFTSFKQKYYWSATYNRAVVESYDKISQYVFCVSFENGYVMMSYPDGYQSYGSETFHPWGKDQTDPSNPGTDEIWIPNIKNPGELSGPYLCHLIYVRCIRDIVETPPAQKAKNSAPLPSRKK